MKTLTKALIFSITVLTYSCNRHSSQWPLLDRVDALMEESPDSALAIMSTIHADSLTGDEERARYALLMTQAMVKNYYVIEEDSLIRIALNHYSQDESSFDFMRSSFYAGEIAYNQARYPQAMDLMMRSEEAAQKGEHIYWQAKIAELKADIFGACYNLTKWTQNTRLAARLYKEAGKERNHLFSTVDYALTFFYRRRPEKAVAMMDSIYAISMREPADSALAAFALETELEVLISMGKIDDVISCIEKIEGLDPCFSLDSQNHSKLAAMLLLKGRDQEAVAHLRVADTMKASVSDSAASLVAWAKLYSKRGESDRAIQCIDSALAMQNHEVRRVLQESVVSAESDHFSDKSQRSERELILVKALFWISTLFLCALLAAVWIFYRMRIKEKAAETEALVQGFKNLLPSFAADPSDGPEDTLESARLCIRRELENLFKKSLQPLDSLCSQYFEMGDASERVREILIRKIEAGIEELTSDNNMEEIERSVNRYMDGAVDKLRNEYRFKAADVRLLALTMAGFSARAICYLLKIKTSNYYKKKKRLTDRIRELDAPNRGEILSRLS